ncbi:MAG: tripartite tricarboxylate transporter substrate binding protein [Deltaproteobacteria bacterium]|nr:MAG: tripartite tricarboxylate transporter substrate binding protein [Deltaproteobacteria bacterium]
MIVYAVVLVFVLVGAMVSPLCAQSYPTKPIRFVLPYPPGGPTDFLGRLIGQKLGERLGQPVVPDNRPGAGGNVGTEVAAKAPPDGYTIAIGGLWLSISPSLYKKLNYDPLKDLAPISIVSQSPNLLLVHPSLPVKGLKDLVEYARTNPGKLNFSSSGVGSPLHLAGELFKSLVKIDVVHVPYKGGGGPALTALMGGEVQMMVLGPGASMPQINAHKVKALAALTTERIPSLPDVPTAKEAGIDLVVTSWHGILAPAGTPRDIVNRLSAEWTKIAAMPDIQEKMRNAGFEAKSSTPEQFAEFIKAETTLWGKVIKEAKVPTID